MVCLIIKWLIFRYEIWNVEIYEFRINFFCFLNIQIGKVQNLNIFFSFFVVVIMNFFNSVVNMYIKYIWDFFFIKCT